MYIKSNAKFCINKYDKDKNLLGTYYSYTQASKEGNINRNYLRNIIKSDNKTGKGFIWEKIDVV